MATLAKARIDPGNLAFFRARSDRGDKYDHRTQRRKSWTHHDRGDFGTCWRLAAATGPTCSTLVFTNPGRSSRGICARNCTSDAATRAKSTSPVDLGPLPAIVDAFRQEGVEAIAICFLHAYLNGMNERTVADRIRELWPGVSVIPSHSVSREWREYERTNTVVLSAYVQPITCRYVESLESSCARPDSGRNRNNAVERRYCDGSSSQAKSDFNGRIRPGKRYLCREMPRRTAWAARSAGARHRGDDGQVCAHR